MATTSALKPAVASLRGMKDFAMRATITCPQCGHQAREAMPTDACLRYYRCAGCQTLLRALPGDCCVFCSYADAPCPPVQLGGSSCP